MFMTKEHTLTLSKAFFYCEKAIGTKPLFDLIKGVTIFSNEKPCEPFEFKSIEIINAHKACIIIRVKILNANKLLTGEIHLRHGQRILEALNEKLANEYLKDRRQEHLREYYAKNLSDKLAI